MKTSDAAETKGGMTRDEALTVALPIARREARKLRPYYRGSVDMEDAESAAVEHILMGWARWEPSKAPWGAWATQWARVGAGRACNKLKSVVTTNYEERGAVAHDEGVMKTDADGIEYARDEMPTVDAEAPHRQARASEKLAGLYDAFVWAAKGMNEAHRAFAQEWVEAVFADDLDLKALAAKHGMSRPTAYKVRDALFKAAHAAKFHGDDE